MRDHSRRQMLPSRKPVGFRLGISHRVPAPPRPSRTQLKKVQETERRRVKTEESKKDLIRLRVLREADREIADEFFTEGEHQLEPPTGSRVRQIASKAVASYKPESGERFSEFSKVFHQFCSLQLAISREASETYVELELRRLVEDRVTQIREALRRIDAVRAHLEVPVYRLRMKLEVQPLLVIDLIAWAQSIIRGVERRIIELAGTGKGVRHKSPRGYSAVYCKSGVTKRTRCFLILDSAESGPPTILALKTAKEYNDAQARDLLYRGGSKHERDGSRYANRPRCLRH